MSADFEIVRFDLRREPDGLYVATSRDLEGVCIVHRERDEIIEDMPNIVRLWYKRHKDMDVRVFWGQEEIQADGTFSIPTVALLAEVAAQRIGR